VQTKLVLTTTYAVLLPHASPMEGRSLRSWRPWQLGLRGRVSGFRQAREWARVLRDADPTAVATPPLLTAFDLLCHERRDLTGRPLRDRRARLEDFVAGSELVFPARRLLNDGSDTLTAGNGLAHIDEHGSCRRSI